MTSVASVSQPSDDVLDVRNVSVRFASSLILHDLSFHVPRGTSLAIVGPNGAGKTVLLRTLLGSIPYEGSIRWAPDVRIGYVPQKLDLMRDVPISGVDLLRARASLAGAGKTAIADALALVGLPIGGASLPIGALSGGQFQRLLIAFALIGMPNVLLLDEPTAGVDEPGQERLNELVHRLQQEQHLTVLLISHELTIVYRYATIVLCLSRDHVWMGPPREILTPELLHDVYGTSSAFHVHDR